MRSKQEQGIESVSDISTNLNYLVDLFNLPPEMGTQIAKHILPGITIQAEKTSVKKVS